MRRLFPWERGLYVIKKIPKQPRPKGDVKITATLHNGTIEITLPAARAYAYLVELKTAIEREREVSWRTTTASLHVVIERLYGTEA